MPEQQRQDLAPNDSRQPGAEPPVPGMVPGPYGGWIAGPKEWAEQDARDDAERDEWYADHAEDLAPEQIHETVYGSDEASL